MGQVMQRLVQRGHDARAFQHLAVARRAEVHASAERAAELARTLRDPQTRAREMVVSVEHGRLGTAPKLLGPDAPATLLPEEDHLVRALLLRREAAVRGRVDGAQLDVRSREGRLALEVIGGHSLLFTWKGRDEKAKPMLLMAHQDVVPIAPGTEGQWLDPADPKRLSDAIETLRGLR